MSDHWNHLVEQPDLWKAPLRPSKEDVDHIKKQLLPNFRTLLLGVTSELLPFAAVAIDNNIKAVQKNSEIAVFGDWAELPFESEFDAVIGDGCLNVFQGSHVLFFKQMKKALRKGGKLILRVFTSAEEKEELAKVLKDKEKVSFDSFQLRVTNAIANPYISVQERLQIIKPIWDHPNLKIYEGSSLTYYHPKLSDLPPFDEIQFSSSYDLAERCPTITWYYSSL